MDQQNNIDEIITAILKAEGGSKVTDDPADGGGRTQYGISEKSNPDAWADNVVTEAEARSIYRKRYVEQPGFDRISDARLQHFLVDFGVTSGPRVAISYLQRLVRVEDDGVLGPRTLAKITESDAKTLLRQLIVERVKMICRIVQKNPSQSRFLVGWINRCFEFMEY
jgi:lysozyme family protein